MAVIASVARNCHILESKVWKLAYLLNLLNFSEDLEVVTRNIRQFLDNNQIAVEEIAIETGLSKDDIEAFMEYGSSLSGENQRELYKWYLTKVLRPPNENSTGITA